MKVASGLETYYVIRSNREHPELSEGLGWTYQHHPDIAVWHGRFYDGWNSCKIDEELKKDADDFGKAMCFFVRKDGAIVGIGKKGWVPISAGHWENAKKHKAW